MKKFCPLVLMLALLLIMPTTAFAASKDTYRLDELGLSIDIPSDYIVFTREIADNDPNLSVLGLTKKDLLDSMESGNIYLDVWDSENNCETIVTMVSNTISNFSLMSDTILNTLASSFYDEFAKIGITIEKHEIYQHEQAKFIKFYMNRPNGADTIYSLQYYTVYDNMAINVTTHSFSGRINSDKESVIESIVSTVHFDKEPLRAEILPDTEAFLYRDENTGIEFTVPANWTQEPLSKDREIIDVKFSSNREPGLIIFYGSIDIWNEMPPSEKAGYVRSDIDNTIFPSEELAEAIGIEKNEVSTVSYGGKEYYKYSFTTSSSEYGFDFVLTQTCLIRVENGYYYSFQFTGDSTSPYYEDFESIVESVTYPAVEGTPPSNHDDPVESTLPSDYEDAAESVSPPGHEDVADRSLPASHEAPSDRNLPSNFDYEYSIPNILFSLLITVIVYSVPIMIYRYGVVKQPVEAARAKRITIIYAVIAFIVMSVLLFITGNGPAGGAIVLWSWVNYKVLTCGKNQHVKGPGSGVSQTIPLVGDQQGSTLETGNIISPPDSSGITRNPQTDSGEEDVMFCDQCGTRLSRSHQFCHKCGSKVTK